MSLPGSRRSEKHLTLAPSVAESSGARPMPQTTGRCRRELPANVVAARAAEYDVLLAGGAA